MQVIASGVDDAIVDGDISYTIVTDAAVSADTDYNGLAASDVAVTNLDNDGGGGGVTVFSVSPDAMNAGTSIDVVISGSGFGAGATVTFENGSGPAPSANVTSVSGDGSTIGATIIASGGGPRGSRVWDVRVSVRIKFIIESICSHFAQIHLVYRDGNADLGIVHRFDREPIVVCHALLSHAALRRAHSDDGQYRRHQEAPT